LDAGERDQCFSVFAGPAPDFKRFEYGSVVPGVYANESFAIALNMTTWLIGNQFFSYSNINNFDIIS
jgi:hypothetical protein